MPEELRAQLLGLLKAGLGEEVRALGVEELWTGMAGRTK